MPDFHIGAYRDFLTNVRKEGRVGLVMLVCGEHEDDEEFKRDVLCDPELVKCLKEKEIMVWGADIGSREGYQGKSDVPNTQYASTDGDSLTNSPHYDLSLFDLRVSPSCCWLVAETQYPCEHSRTAINHHFKFFPHSDHHQFHPPAYRPIPRTLEEGKTRD